MSSNRNDCDNDRDDDRNDRGQSSNDRDNDRDCGGGSNQPQRNNIAKITGDVAASVTEDSGKYTVTGDLSVTDSDRGEAKLQSVSNKAGTYGKFSVDSSGNWTYVLDNSSTKVQALNAGQKVYDTFVVKSYDGSAEKTITVTVNGTNEAAPPQSASRTIGGPATGSVTEDLSTAKSSTGKLTIDGKTTSSGFNTLTKQGVYGTFTMKADGTWAYVIDNTKAATQALNASDHKTESFEISTKAVDNNCGPDYASVKKMIVVTVNGADEAPTSTPVATIGGDAEGVVKEDTAPQTVDSGRLTINGQNSASGFNTLTQAGTYGTFKMAADGTWTYTIDNSKAVVQGLNEGQTVTESFSVTSKAVAGNGCTPGTASATKTVLINVLGTDEAPQSSPVVTGTTSLALIEDVVLSNSGKLNVTGDTGFQAASLSSTYGNLSLTTAGNWTFTLNNSSASVQSLAANEVVNSVFNVKTASGTNQALTVQVTGTNDAPVAANDDGGSLGFFDGYRALIDTLANDTDIDHGAILHVASVQGTSNLGASVVIVDGKASYDASNVFIEYDNIVTDQFTYVAMDEHGATSTATVTVTLVGPASGGGDV